jgi:hypothetical protein
MLPGLPFKFHWLLVVLMAAVIPLATYKTEKPGEFYPFSNFPMYSRFEPDTYYVYVMNKRGEIVPVGTTFGRSISDLKKTYDSNLKRVKAEAKLKVDKMDLPSELKAKAAVTSLEWLISITPKSQLEALRKHEGLVLHEVQIVCREGKIHKTDAIVGQSQLPTSTQLP